MASQSQAALVVKNPSANAEDRRGINSIPGSGRFPRGGNGNLLQYSCLGNPMDRGAWRGQIESGTSECLSTYARTHRSNVQCTL